MSKGRKNRKNKGTNTSSTLAPDSRGTGRRRWPPFFPSNDTTSIGGQDSRRANRRSGSSRPNNRSSRTRFPKLSGAHWKRRGHSKPDGRGATVSRVINKVKVRGLQSTMKDAAVVDLKREVLKEGASHWRLILLSALIIMALANVYLLFFRKGTSLGEIQRLKTAQLNKEYDANNTHLPVPIAKDQKPDTLPAKLSNDSVSRIAESGAVDSSSTMTANDPNSAELNTDKKDVQLEGSMAGHSSLSGALGAAGIIGANRADIISALREHLDFRSLRPRHSFKVTMDPATDHVRYMTYQLSPINRIHLIRKSDGTFSVTKKKRPLERKTVVMGGKLEGSLTKTIIDAGGNSALVNKFVQMFSWDINWFADPRPGDEVRIVAEESVLDGEHYRYERILSASYIGKSVKLTLYGFNKANGVYAYFTADGRAVRKSFLKTPLRFHRRISSEFNPKRLHPILKKKKPHNGIDYAAPTGTPIFAAADGIVASAAYSRGSGNMVILRHSDG